MIDIDKELRNIDFSLREISVNLKKEQIKDYTKQYNVIHIITASIVLLTTAAIFLSGFILFSYFNEIGIKSLFLNSETQTSTQITIFFTLVIYVIYSTTPSFIQIAIINFSTKQDLTHIEKLYLVLSYICEGIIAYILIVRLLKEETLLTPEIFFLVSTVITSIFLISFSNLKNKTEYLFLCIVNLFFLAFSSLFMPAKNIHETIYNGEHSVYFCIVFIFSLIIRCICLWSRDNKFTLTIPILLIFSLLNLPTHEKLPNVKEFIIKSIGLADINNKPYLIEENESYDINPPILNGKGKYKNKIFCGKLLWNNGNTTVFLPYYENNPKNNFKIPSKDIIPYQGKHYRQFCSYVEKMILSNTVTARVYNETIRSYLFINW